MLLSAWLFDEKDHTGLNVALRHHAMLIGGAVAILPTIGLVALAWRSTIGRRSTRELYVGAAIGAGLGLWLAFSLGLEWTNRHFDTSEPSRTEWKVIRLLSSPGKEPAPNAIIQLVDGGDDAKVGLRIPARLMSDIVPGASHIIIARRDGSLGWRHYSIDEVLPLPAEVDAKAISEAREAARGSEATRVKPLPTARIVGIVAVLVTIGVALVHFARRKVARELGARVGVLATTGRHRNLEYRLADGWLRLRPLPAQGILVARSRTALEELAERFSYSRRAASGDSEFDAALAVESNPPDAAARLVVVPEARTVLRDLVAAESDVVRMDEEGLATTCRLPKVSAPQVIRLLDRLSALHGLIVTHVEPAVSARRMLGLRTKRVLQVGSIVLLMAGAGALFATMMGEPREVFLQLVADLLPWGIGFSLLTLPIAIRVQRGRLSGAKAAVAALFWVPLLTAVATVCTACLLNRVLESPSGDIRTRLLRFHDTAITLAAWDGSYAEVTLMVAPEGSESLTAPCDVVLHLRKGCLGYERIASIEEAPR